MDFELDDEDEQKDQARHRGEHEPCGVRGCNSCHKRFLHFLMFCVLWVLFQRRPADGHRISMVFIDEAISAFLFLA